MGSTPSGSTTSLVEASIQGDFQSRRLRDLLCAWCKHGTSRIVSPYAGAIKRNGCDRCTGAGMKSSV